MISLVRLPEASNFVSDLINIKKWLVICEHGINQGLQCSQEYHGDIYSWVGPNEIIHLGDIFSLIVALCIFRLYGNIYIMTLIELF